MLWSRFSPSRLPPWQNPDEPAHYNYVAYLATEGKLPVLQMGDYDGAYLERLKTEKFPPALSIDPVRYEFHQPPLYYLLAAPVYWLSGGSLLALRLFSAVLGAGVVLLIFLCARTVLPGSPHIALGAAAFTAFLPMHIAVMASVNNDALAELIVAAAMLALLRWQTTFSNDDPAGGSLGSARRLLLATGLLIGVGFLTKATAYILLPIALIVVAAGIVWRTQARPLTARAQFTQYALLIAPALLLGLPWWIRNSLLYGNGDFLGLAWHDVVVTGQPTAAAWIADNGWSAYWVRAWTFTSKSFWGVFGWLGVFMDARIYTALFVLSLMAAVGALLRCRRWTKGDKKRWLQFPSSPWMALLLLVAGCFRRLCLVQRRFHPAPRPLPLSGSAHLEPARRRRMVGRTGKAVRHRGRGHPAGGRGHSCVGRHDYRRSRQVDASAVRRGGHWPPACTRCCRRKSTAF